MAFSQRPQIILNDTDRHRLDAIIAAPTSPQKHVWRARMILELGAGCGLAETMRRTGLSKPTVWRWWDRVLVEGVDGLLRDRPHRRGQPPVSENQVKALVDWAMSPPPPHRTHGTLKAMAHAVGLAISTVHGILNRHGLKPHRVKTFKLSNDPRFGIKAQDVVGLSMNPPDHAVVLSVDEKTQIQALGRTQTPLPLQPGQAETCTHDDQRNGTTTLLAALDVATGTVVGQMTQQHRSEDFCAFLDHVATGLDPTKDVHVILDKLSAHKSARVHAWLKAHPNWTFHFTPTSASWMNAVEGVFSKLARQRLKNAICDSREACIAAVEDDIAHHNAHDAQPFRWSRDPKDLIAAWKRGHQKLQNRNPHKESYH